MGGVDLFDQYRAYYKLELRSVKYWHPMFWFIIESALVNAWILYCQTAKAQNKEVNITQRVFRALVAKGLAEDWEARGCVGTSEANMSPSKRMKLPSKAVRVHLRGAGMVQSGRFGCPSGHSEFFAKLPEKEGTSKNPKISPSGSLIYPSHRSMACRYCSEVEKLTKPKRTSF
jgi:hypothetical protein